MTSQVVQITDGQASATVTGPLHNGDSASFVVPAPAPPPTGYDVGFNGPMSAFDAFLRGNPGRRIGLGSNGQPLNASAMIDLRAHTVDIVQLAPIVTTFKGIGLVVRGCHGRWTNHVLRGPTTWSQIAGKRSGAGEQFHGLMQQGGDIVFDHPDVSGFNGDLYSARPWPKANGGDDRPPVVTWLSPKGRVGGRCGFGIIQCLRATVTDMDLDQIGAWPIDIEPNAVIDENLAMSFVGGRIGAIYGQLAEPGWMSGGEFQAFQTGGPATTVKEGPLVISGITFAGKGDLYLRNLTDVVLSNLRAGKPSKVINAGGIGHLTQSGLVGYS